MARPSEDYFPTDETGHGVTTERYFNWARALQGADGLIRTNYTGFAPPDLKVTANGTSNITVAAGKASIMGVCYTNSLSFTVPITANNAATSRTDLIVVRVDHHDTGFQASVGRIAGSGSIRPTVVREHGTVYDLPLAYVTVPAGSSTVPANNVQDLRYAGTPGNITLDTNVPAPYAIAGQIMSRPGPKVYVGQADGSWVQVYPDVPVVQRVAAGAGGLGFAGNLVDFNDVSDSTYGYVAYAKDAAGWVYLSGQMSLKANVSPKGDGAIAFLLPATHRPSAGRKFAVAAYNRTAGETSLRQHNDFITIHSDGPVTMDDGLYPGGWISFEGVFFRAAT